MTDQPATDRELFVHHSPFETDVVYVVNAAALAAARAADEEPYLETFGDLRMSGDVTELEERLLRQHNLTLADYITAIEHAAGMEAGTGDPTTRLAAVAGVTFDGADVGDEWAPGDDTGFPTDWEMEEQPAPEYRGLAVIARATRDDLPAEVFERFGKENYGDSPAFSGFIDCGIRAEHLDEALAELRALGYVVAED